KETLGPPHCGSAYIPEVGKEGRKRRESTTAYRERKRVVTFLYFTAGHNCFALGSRRHALTSFSILSNIRLVSWGSSGMVGASRCFASNFFQLGGDHALEGLQRFSDPGLADSLCTPAPLHSATKIFGSIHGRK